MYSIGPARDGGVSGMLRTTRQRHQGFNLVELMIGLAVGLVVTGAVSAYVATTLSNNNATVRSTRLAQELRTLAEVVARDLRRARSLQDPFVNIGSNCTNNASCAIASSTVATNNSADCVTYAYEGAPGGNFRALRRVESDDGVGSLILARGNSARTCDSSGTTINSDLVDITSFVLCTSTTPIAVCPNRPTQPGQIDISIGGMLRGDQNAITQVFRTSVYVRSTL